MPPSVTPNPGTRPSNYFDERGLYLEVSPAGGKWWRLKSRFGGKEKRVSFGVYPDVSLKDARERREASRKLLVDGVDRSENRRAAKSSRSDCATNSLEVVAQEWLSKYSSTWAANHRDRVIRLFERDIFPWIGGRPIAEVTPPELLAVLRRIENRGALETAPRALGKYRQLFRYTVATGRCDRDTSRDLRGALPPIKGGHFVATTEPRRVAEILRVMDGFEGTLIVLSAIRLAPLLFVRPGELRKTEWAQLDLESAVWRCTVIKTDVPHIVPLCRQRVHVLGASGRCRMYRNSGSSVTTSGTAFRSDRIV